MHIVYMVRARLAASEATSASKQPWRSKLSVQVKLVTPIYNMTKFQGTFISQKSLMSPGGDDKQGPLTCVAIAAGKKQTSRKIIQQPCSGYIRKSYLLEIVQTYPENFFDSSNFICIIIWRQWSTGAPKLR